MSQSQNPTPKSPTSHLHVLNLVIATLAGIISIVGGIYTLKSNVFSGPSYGILQGIVRDEKIAKPLLLASVEVSAVDGAVVNTVTTDQEGHYRVESLKAGNYVVKFTAPLHENQTKTVKIEKDQIASINVDLVPEPAATKSFVPEAVVPVQTIPQAGVSPSGMSTTAIPATQSTPVPVSNAGTSSYSAATASDMAPPPSFHRRRRPYYGETNSGAEDTSQSSAFAQAGAQLLQGLFAKKTTDDQSSQGS